jgi:hypothetical protein
VKKIESLYPDYDVLALRDEWDANTRTIVNKRLGPFQFQVLSGRQQELVKAVATQVAVEDREEVLTWIAAHVDEQLSTAQGESQRKPGIPPRRELILTGLEALDEWAKGKFFKGFLSIKPEQQLEFLELLEVGGLPQENGWDTERQKELFKKLASLIISAEYSHPWVWSEIGYGGPAYPRGYVRVELGLTDPWEPKPSVDSGKGEGR